jgi:AraC family transcriptional regulator of adaptative response / DNA-3-methyladenine glycosylase II
MPEPELDPRLCQQARQSRDPRFDGEFFVAVKTTGIYCRPVCPARAPAERNVHYYRSAAQAAASGYRPCLRCRPESAPGSPAWRGSSATVSRALRLIEEGALADASVAALANRLGVGERYLRKLFQRELGVSPQGVALNQRLLFAKKLLAETSLPITEVAFAAGFGSVRRFNSAVREHFRLTPGQLRGRKLAPVENGLPLELHYRPPYDWAGVMDFFSRHAVAGVEAVTAEAYQRNISIDGKPASFTVEHRPANQALRVVLRLPDARQMLPVVARIRRMFDLDANPATIHSQLAKDPALAPLLARFPGIRAPLAWSLFESSVRTIVGQQVSVAAARGVCSRLAAACTGRNEVATFPDAASLAALGDQHFPMPTRRRDTLRKLATDYSGRDTSLDLASLAEYRGVGPWTVSMVAMRGVGDPDIFPSGDLGLEKAWAAVTAPGEKPGNEHTCNWRPWRSYAANLLWRSLN